MRILLAQSDETLRLLEEGPLRREDLEIRALPGEGEDLDRALEEGADLVILAGDQPAGLVDRLRRRRMAVRPVADADEAARVLAPLGVPLRAETRRPLHLPARLDTGGIRMRGRTKDLSSTGSFLCCPPRAEPGARGTLLLETPGGNLELPVQVARVEEGDGYRASGVGLRFVAPAPEVRSRLEELLADTVPPPRIPRLHYPDS